MMKNVYTLVLIIPIMLGSPVTLLNAAKPQLVDIAANQARVVEGDSCVLKDTMNNSVIISEERAPGLRTAASATLCGDCEVA